jgi:hypothetical protein
MDINWKLPFEILAELFLFVLGWTLVAVMVFITFAIILGLVKGTKQVIVGSKKENKAKTAKTVEEPLQPMLGVVEPADNLSAIQLKKLLERGTD